jgi:hypothetical protein
MTTDATMPDLPKDADYVVCLRSRSRRKWGCDIYHRNDTSIDSPRWQGEGTTIPEAIRDALREVEPGVTEIRMEFEVY